ncbi:MAG: L,D-transpeptidase family protein [Bacillota bacterium]|nr:L,D-transpeptidase family protein [Bacillota bacterium]
MKQSSLVISITLVLMLYLLSYSSSAKAVSFDYKDTTIKYNILVDLNDSKLFLIEIKTNKIVKTYPVAGGKPSTPSPLGTWKIIGKAKWDKGFGTRWMRLNVPWGQYGIHGTNKPLTIGGSSSLGCIRMYNNNVEELFEYVPMGTTVVIYGGPYGLFTNEFRKLTPGDTGADVFEVQRQLNFRGYYNETLDGIYSDTLKKAVIKYRKDNKLTITHDIDKEFYNSLNILPFE